MHQIDAKIPWIYTTSTIKNIIAKLCKMAKVEIKSDLFIESYDPIPLASQDATRCCWASKNNDI